MAIDLEPIRRRAMLIRDVTLPWSERGEAILTSSDNLLAMIAEVEAMRQACSPQAIDLATRINALSMFPVGGDTCLRNSLAHAISQLIYQWAYDHRPKRRKGCSSAAHTWDISAVPKAIGVMGLVEGYIKQAIHGEPVAGVAKP
jgi:hypothetical protein